MSTKKESNSEYFLNDLLRRLDRLGIPQHGRGVFLAEVSGYSKSLVSEVLSGKKTCTKRFYNLALTGLTKSESFCVSEDREPYPVGLCESQKIMLELLKSAQGRESELIALVQGYLAGGVSKGTGERKLKKTKETQKDDNHTEQ